MNNKTNKINWKYVSVIALLAVVAVTGLLIYVMKELNAEIALCSTLPGADKNFGVPAIQKYQTVPLKDVIQYYDENKNTSLAATGSIVDLKIDGMSASILLTDNYGYHILATVSNADMAKFNSLLPDLKKGDVIRVGGIAGFTFLKDWSFDESFMGDNRSVEKVGMIYAETIESIDNTAGLLENLKQNTGINFSTPQPVEFEFSVAQNKSSQKTTLINGLGINAAITGEKKDLIKDFFVNRGFDTAESLPIDQNGNKQTIYNGGQTVCSEAFDNNSQITKINCGGKAANIN